MWKMVLAFIPEWKVLVQALVTFLIPFGISMVFRWIRQIGED